MPRSVTRCMGWHTLRWQARTWRPLWTRQLARSARWYLCGLPVRYLGLPAHSSAAQSHILIAIPPAVDSALNESALLPQYWVKLRKSPAHRITLALVMQSIALVCVFVAARSGIYAIVRFELLTELVNVDGLNVTPNRVLHFDAISRVLKGYPLDTVVVLPYH